VENAQSCIVEVFFKNIQETEDFQNLNGSKINQSINTPLMPLVYVNRTWLQGV